jgi:cytochrome c oxidase subunit IV
MANVHTHDGPNDGGAAQRKVIWKTFWILLILTALEFLIAFTVPHGTMKITIFILMTFVKAWYIVGDFMHLKHEAKGLVWSIVLPMIFIVWLLVALVIEGTSIFNAVWL